MLKNCITKLESKVFILERLYPLSPSPKQKLSPKKIMNQKKFCVKKNVLGPQKNLGLRKFWVQRKIVRPKKFCVRNFFKKGFCSKKRVGSEKIVGQK